MALRRILAGPAGRRMYPYPMQRTFQLRNLPDWEGRSDRLLKAEYRRLDPGDEMSLRISYRVYDSERRKNNLASVFL
jgi:hypothetical protein